MLLVPAGLVLMLQFNNCSKYKQDLTLASADSSSNAPSSSLSEMTPTGDLCEDSIRQTFHEGYYNFVRTNCAGCHATEIDRPQFANPDPNWAYEVFKQKTYTKISDNALSMQHQPPATGPQHTVAINTLRLEWGEAIAEYNTCKGIDPAAVTLPAKDVVALQLTEKAIPVMTVDQERVITWNLNSDLQVIKSGTVLTNLGGSANFQVTVARRKTSGGQEYYSIRKPIIYSNATGIAVKTMYPLINGRLVTYPSTFKYIDTGVPIGATVSGTTIGQISTGGTVILGTPTDTDKLSFAFEKLELANIAPPPAPAAVGFVGSSVYFVDPTTGQLTFNVQASGDTSSSPVVVTVDEVTDALCGAIGDATFNVNSSGCLPNIYNAMVARGASTSDAANLAFRRARSLAGTSYNRYDWDFKFNINSVTLSGLNAQKSVQVNFSNDIRKEVANRVLRLRVNVVSSNATVSSSSMVYVVILKVNNPAVTAGEVTFASLMRGTGLLNAKCVFCHNSKDLAGGYDMTDYQMMLSKGIVVPADFDPTGVAPMQSKMYRRTNANDPINFNLTPMPLQGGLDVDQRSLIEAWIRAGAKNN
jgi:hypothetical protein